jgi:phosphoribosyl 1,2-cyclic phosphodiesterase
MIIRSWGARGSIAVSGPGYVRYGGDTACLEVRTRNDQIIIVDAGSGIRRLGNRLRAEKRSSFNLFFTHSHWDHILGFPFFKPIYDPKTRIELYGCPMTNGDMVRLLAGVMKPPHFPVPYGEIEATVNYQGVCAENLLIDSVSIRAIPLSHPNLGAGFRFDEGDRSLVFLTDNELGHHHRGGRSFEEYAEFARGADVLIHDAEYTPEEYGRTRSWGHSCHTDALRLALAAGVRSFGLYHHNQDREDDGVDAMVADCQRLAREAGSDLTVFGVTQDSEFIL